MHYITGAVLTAAGFLGGTGVARVLAVTGITAETSVPISALLGSAATILFAGMWVSRKTTAFEIELSQHKAELSELSHRLTRIEDRIWEGKTPTNK